MHLFKRIAAVTAILVACTSAVQAQDAASQIVSQLRSQGFETIRISRTFLGRTRFKASSPNHEREIILNPATGEILRDYWVVRDHGAPAPSSIVNPEDDDDNDGERGRNRNGDGDGHDDDDDGENGHDDGHDDDDDGESEGEDGGEGSGGEDGGDDD